MLHTWCNCLSICTVLQAQHVHTNTCLGGQPHDNDNQERSGATASLRSAVSTQAPPCARMHDALGSGQGQHIAHVGHWAGVAEPHHLIMYWLTSSPVNLFSLRSPCNAYMLLLRCLHNCLTVIHYHLCIVLAFGVLGTWTAIPTSESSEM